MDLTRGRSEHDSTPLVVTVAKGDVILEEEEEMMIGALLVIIVLFTYLCSWIVFYIREGISTMRRQFEGDISVLIFYEIGKFTFTLLLNEKNIFTKNN